jgi:hypothetical protein
MNSQTKLINYKNAHKKLDIRIKELNPRDSFKIQFLKKNKLQLKEKIVKLENELNEQTGNIK